jgi:flagellar basal body P-ring formation protein FlgA
MVSQVCKPQNLWRLILGAILAAGLVTTPCIADSLVLKEETFVKGGTVRLGDVAEIDGDDAVALGDIEIMIAPLPGKSRQIHASLIESRISKAGFTDIEVTGASRVRATALSMDIPKDVVAESLQEFIEMEMPWDLGDAEITVQAPMGLTLPDGVLDIQWYASPQYRYIGKGSFRGKVSVDGASQKTLLCSATVTAYQETVMATRDISRGHPIGPNDIDVRKAPVDPRRQGLQIPPQDVIGLVARKTIFPGQVITTRNANPPIIVRRNQTVPVQMRVGGLVVKTHVRALNDGRVGDRVRCLNPDSKQELQAYIRPDGALEVL